MFTNAILSGKLFKARAIRWARLPCFTEVNNEKTVLKNLKIDRRQSFVFSNVLSVMHFNQQEMKYYINLDDDTAGSISKTCKCVIVICKRDENVRVYSRFSAFCDALLCFKYLLTALDMLTCIRHNMQMKWMVCYNL